MEFLTPEGQERFSNLSLIERVHAIKDVFLTVSASISDKVLKQMEETIVRYHFEAKARVAAKRGVYIPPVGRACGDISKRLRALCFDFYSKSHLPEMVDISLSNMEEAVGLGKIIKAVPLAKVPVGDDGRIRKSVLMLRAKAEAMHLFLDTLNLWSAGKLPAPVYETGPKVAQAFTSRLWEAFMKPIRDS